MVCARVTCPSPTSPVPERIAAPAGAAALKRILGQNVRRLREARGMTRTAFALAAGVSVGYLGQIERGLANPRATTLGAVATALDVVVTTLFSDDTDRHL